MKIEDTIKFRIECNYAELRSSEKKVADYVLAHLGERQSVSLVEVARRSGVSQPTVVRFVKAIGFAGYKDFCYALVMEAAKEEPQPLNAMYGYKLSSEDKMEQVPSKIIATTVAMLEDTLKCISTGVFVEMIAALTQARSIHLFCVENSSATAKDMATKLLYLGLDCRYYEDYYMQRIAAGSLSKEDVAVGISYSGQSRDTVDVMRIAKKSGARTIVITNFEHSIISKYGDLVLCNSHEQLLYGDAIFSRTSQLVIVDMIYMGIILSDYEHFTKQLDKNSRLVHDKAYDVIK